jgi:hypothetical protein
MNVIVFQNQNTISRGILEEYSLQRSDFGEIPLTTVVVRTIDNMLFAVYRFQKDDQEVFLYEPLSGTIRMLLELGTS